MIYIWRFRESAEPTQESSQHEIEVTVNGHNLFSFQLN